MTSTGAGAGQGRIGAVVLGGDYQGLGVARSLGRRGVPLLVIDDERSIAAASRFVRRRLRVPTLRGEQDTLAALRLARSRYDLRGWVLYPTRDETVAAIARHRDELRQHFRVPTPAWPVVRTAWDKRATYRVATELGVPIPRTWFPRARADLAEIDTSVDLLLKPAIKENFFYATGVKGWRVSGRQELIAAFERAERVIGTDDEIIVQEMIPGGGGQQLSYCALFRDGGAVASMTVRRRRQHPSDLGRASTFVETVDCPELAGPSVRFLTAIGYYGLVELEYKRDPRDGVPKLLDVNARTWGYHTVGPAAGVDFAHLLYRDQLGATVPPATARPGVRWVRLATDLPNALRDTLAGDLRLRDYLASLRGVDVEAVFSARDPLPGLYELALLPYLAVRKGL